MSRVSAPIVLRARRWADVETGQIRSPAVIVVDGNRIAAMDPTELPAGAIEHDLGKAAEVFPRARAMLPEAIAAGVRIACGTDAPAVPHGANAKELLALVARGMSPAQALRAATITSAELVELDHELGRLRPGYLADVIAVPGNPFEDIAVTQDVRFVMKDGRIHKGA